MVELNGSTSDWHSYSWWTLPGPGHNVRTVGFAFLVESFGRQQAPREINLRSVG